MMKELEKLFHKRDLPYFLAAERQVFCFPHTVNISTGHVVKALTSAPHEQEPAEDHVPASGQTYAQAVARDPIAMARAAIRAIRSSGGRREAFANVIIDGNRDGRFIVEGEVVQLKSLQLLRDVPTRWDSVFYMIRRFRYLRPVSHCTNLRTTLLTLTL